MKRGNVERMVCKDCENKGCCDYAQVVRCGVSEFELSDYCLSVYDAEVVLVNYLKKMKGNAK